MRALFRIGSSRLLVVYPAERSYDIDDRIRVVALGGLAAELRTERGRA